VVSTVAALAAATPGTALVQHRAAGKTPLISKT
jgi:hypothetical protein